MCNIYSQVIPKCVCVILCLVLLLRESNSLVLRAYFSQHGLHGEIEFSRKNESLISVRTNLKPTLQYPDGVWRWSIHEFPVDYRDLTHSRCSNDNLGKEIIDLTEELGYLIIPGKEHAELDSTNSLTGPTGLWGKSIVLETAERDRVICASIVSTEQRHEKHAIARFTSPVAGNLIFKWLHASEFNEADGYIIADLYHTKAPNKKIDHTEHGWKLFVTDIFDTDKSDRDDDCDVPQIVFNPVSNHGENASVGDFDVRFGKIQVATDPSVKKTKTLFKHEVLNILRSDMEATQRNLYVVLYDKRRKEDFWACARLRLIESKSSKAIIKMDGVRGVVEFTQSSPFDPTWANFSLGASNEDYESNLRYISSVLTYSIRELPPKVIDPMKYKDICNTTGHLYNPTNIETKDIPPAGLGTQDQYPVGDLYGKYRGRTEYLNHRYLLPGLANELSGAYWDAYLPLHGLHSVVHRAVVIERREKSPICGTILLYQPNSEYQLPMTSAQVYFRYPIVGRVVFRQPAEKPWEDTTIIVESMVHADGAAVNNTAEHRWSVTELAPGADYYNWQNRCLSAGQVYEPHHLDVDDRHPDLYCRLVDGLCRVGDLTTRHGTLNIAGKKVDSDRLTRRLFTDPLLQLAGKYSVMKRSLVIFDDHGPVARGERLACSIINGLARRKAVIQDWFGNGQPVPVDGHLEFTQQSEYDITNVNVKLDHLEQVHNYNIHSVPVEKDLEFPCEKTSLLDTFNPFNVSRGASPPTAMGTPDQYMLGDLGEKYGLLDDRESFSTHYNETQLSLFGPHSILGRSMVLHKKVKGRHWACASVARGYSPAEAREARALASFHHPGGFLRGYVRASQLIHSDGSTSDTVLEVNLRYPGERDRNYTMGHNWEIWVNPVGVDAAVQVTHTRCVAGGYRWNPYFTQLADPLNRDLYKQECGADNPLRCDVGDLTSRLGTINIGGSRQMFMDSNFPLEGAVAAVGRSLVVFAPGGSGERLACANIEPDHDIIKFVNIMKPPRFVLGQFLRSVRAVLGAPAWQVSVDARRTRPVSSGNCLQLLLHFQGPRANQLELDFTKLMASGRLEAPTIYIPGYVDTKRKKTTPYRQCGVTDPTEKKKSFFFSSSPSGGDSSRHRLVWISLLPLAIILLMFKLN